jgi:hypothetical protein
MYHCCWNSLLLRTPFQWGWTRTSTATSPSAQFPIGQYPLSPKSELLYEIVMVTYKITSKTKKIMQRKQPHNQGKYIKIEYQCQDFKCILNHEMSKDMCAVHYKRKLFLLQVNSSFKLFSRYPLLITTEKSLKGTYFYY